MKTKLFFWHSKLIRQGNYGTARQILLAMNRPNKQIFISDYNNEAYNSGFAGWLISSCKWFNNKNGFIAILK